MAIVLEDLTVIVSGFQMVSLRTKSCLETDNLRVLEMLEKSSRLTK